MGVEAARIYATIGANLSGFESGMARAGGAINSVGARMDRFGSRARAVGGAMTRGITLPVVAVGAAAVHMANDFDRSMTDVQALVGASDAQMKQYKASVLEMSKTMPQGPRDLADALYFVTSSGFEGASALRVLKASAMAAAAGLGATETVADAVTSAVNAYGEKSLSAARATDILLAAVREGKAEPEELAASIGRVIAPAEAMKIEFGEVAGAVAALSTTGLDAAEGVTAVRGMLMGLLHPAKQTREFLHDNGIEMDALRDSIAKKGLLTTLQSLRDRFGDNKDALGLLFPNVRALNGFLSLTGANAKKNAQIMRDVAKAHGDTAKAFAAAMESNRNKAKVAWSSIQADLISLGAVALPIIAEIMQNAAKLADSFTRLSPKAQHAIIGIVAGFALLGPIVGLIGTIATAIGGLVTAVGFLLTPVGALTIGVGLLAAGMLAAKFAPEQFQAALERMGVSAQTAQTVVTTFGHAFDLAKTLVTFAVNTIRNVVQTGFATIGHLVGLVTAILTGDWGSAWNHARGLVTTAVSGVVNTVRNMVSLVLGIWNSFSDGMKVAAIKTVLFILEPFSHLPSKMGGWARAAKSSLENSLAQINLDKMSRRLSSELSAVGGAMTRRAGGVGADIGHSLSSGIASGIFAGINSVVNAAASVVAAAESAARSRADSHSPSRVFAERVGKPLSQGVAKGIEDNGWMVVQAASHVIQLTETKSTGWAVAAGQRVGKAFSQAVSKGIAEIPIKLQIAEVQAELTGDVQAQIKALQAEAIWLAKLAATLDPTSKKYLEVIQALLGVNNQIKSLTESLKDAGASAEDAGTQAAGAVASAVTSATSSVSAAEPVLETTIAKVTDAVTKFGTSSMFEMGRSFGDTVADGLKSTGGTIASAAQEAAVQLRPWGLEIAANLKNIGGQAERAEQFTGHLRDMLLQLDGTSANTYLTEHVTRLVDVFTSDHGVVGGGGGNVGGISTAGQHVPLASGGIVTSPTFALVGEAGPEAVIPLSQLGGGGPIVVEVHEHTYLDGAEIAENTRTHLVQIGRRRGGNVLEGQA